MVFCYILAVMSEKKYKILVQTKLIFLCITFPNKGFTFLPKSQIVAHEDFTFPQSRTAGLSLFQCLGHHPRFSSIWFVWTKICRIKLIKVESHSWGANERNWCCTWQKQNLRKYFTQEHFQRLYLTFRSLVTLSHIYSGYNIIDFENKSYNRHEDFQTAKKAPSWSEGQKKSRPKAESLRRS